MSLVPHIREGSRGLISWRVAIMCVATLAVLLARSDPPSFPNISLSPAVTSHADHDHRQSLEHQNPEWVISPLCSLTAALPVAPAHHDSNDGSLVEVVTDGWHYNRPPPINQPS